MLAKSVSTATRCMPVEMFIVFSLLGVAGKRLEHSQVDEIPRITADMRVLQDSQSVQVKRVDELVRVIRHIIPSRVPGS